MTCPQSRSRGPAGGTSAWEAGVHLEGQEPLPTGSAPPHPPRISWALWAEQALLPRLLGARRRAASSVSRHLLFVPTLTSCPSLPRRRE